MSQGKRWCFTWFVEDEVEGNTILTSLPSTDGPFVLGEYGGAQLESCPTTGRVHIQGFCGWATNKRFNSLQASLPGVHWESMKGTLEQNKRYCSKSDTSISDYKAWGTWPENKQGKRSDLDAAVATLRSTDGSTRDKLKAVAEAHGSAFVKCYKGFKVLADTLAEPELPDKPIWRPWQLNLEIELEGAPDDRTIIWYNDPIGGAGKSKFVSYYTAVPALKAVALSGKLADMRYAFMEHPGRIVFFDIARAEKEYVQHMYTMAEELKNGRFMNSKYESKPVFFKPPHVVFFTNMMPDHEKWSADRLKYREFLSDGTLPLAGFSAASLPIPGGEPAGGAGMPLSQLSLFNN